MAPDFALPDFFMGMFFKSGERRLGSATPEGEPCRHAIVFDKEILVASTAKCSSLYDPLSDTWSEGPGCKLNLLISCLISVRERHVLALCTRTKSPKVFHWSPFLVEADASGKKTLEKKWAEMPPPRCQPCDVRGVEVNGRIFVVGLAFQGQSKQVAMFISLNDAHPDAWVPEGQWTAISELSFHGLHLNLVLANGDIYLMCDSQLGPNDRENAVVFMPAIEDRRSGRPLQSSSSAPMPLWKWQPLAKFSHKIDYEYGGVCRSVRRRDVGADDGDEFDSPKRITQDSESVIDDLRHTGQSSNVVPDDNGDASVA
nr:unnamed protein product [Spirometra erinaceieuropaei]